ITVPTITVKLDKERSERLSRWAHRRKVTKSEVVRSLIDRAGPVETGEELAAWVAASEGTGLGLAQRGP
ncbi:MAG: CopG family transcriptional regulator, partial [Opitutaceae bacterium]